MDIVMIHGTAPSHHASRIAISGDVDLLTLLKFEAVIATGKGGVGAADSYCWGGNNSRE